MAAAEMVHKVVLSSGKVVLFRPMKIKTQNLIVQAIGNRAGDNQLLAQQLMQQELVKVLLVSIDGKVIPPQELEDLDALFEYMEYQQLTMAINKANGSATVEELGKFALTHENIG